MSKGFSAALAEMPGAAPKDSTNPHAKYKYASADSIYSTVRKYLAAAGLAVWQHEVSVDIEMVQERNGQARMARVTYAMALTQDGVAPPEEAAEHVTVESVIRGPQSWAALRTFALKYWLRGKCLLATGDQAEDLDYSGKLPESTWVSALPEPDPRIDIAHAADAEALTIIALDLRRNPANVQPALRAAMKRRVKQLGLRWDGENERYVDPAEQEPPPEKGAPKDGISSKMKLDLEPRGDAATQIADRHTGVKSAVRKVHPDIQAFANHVLGDE